jgi:hypothetical protein
MPTFAHGKGTTVYVDEFDLTAYFNSADVTLNNETAEITAFGATSKAYLLGLADGTLSLSGLWSQTTDGSDEELHALLGSTTTPLVTVAKNIGTVGNRAMIAKAHEVNYAISNPVGDVSTITADFQGSTDAVSNLTYGITGGVQLLTGASSNVLDFPMTLAGVDNSASSANGGVGVLHAPTNTIAGGTTTYKIQHDTVSNFASAADLITFTAIAASTATSQMVAVSGTVNRYVRATATTAGSSGNITVMVSFARF